MDGHITVCTTCLIAVGVGVSCRSADIISSLVNIYGSKELFVNEYRTLLADRILTHFNYDTEKEIRYLELLKLRFGESQLHLCEVSYDLLHFKLLMFTYKLTATLHLCFLMIIYILLLYMRTCTH